jgi:cyclopropane fatty-acyl-phospholipid synthase-like methyltransferase
VLGSHMLIQVFFLFVLFVTFGTLREYWRFFANVHTFTQNDGAFLQMSFLKKNEKLKMKRHKLTPMAPGKFLLQLIEPALLYPLVDFTKSKI